ncbi:MAG: phasin, PhaP, partial [Rhodobacteraceae bacterium]|nr:phasin, PhaP [Paracoccaceae bacterium]
DSLSLFLSTAKEVQTEAVSAVKKAANDVSPAKKKAAN